MKQTFLLIAIVLLGLPNLKAQVKKQKITPRIIEEHRKWDKCIIILANGDTVPGRLKKGKPYSPSVLYVPVRYNKVQFAYNDDTEQDFKPEELKKLIIPGAPEGYKEYFAVVTKDEQAMARPLVSGKCSLLIAETNYYSLNMLTENGSFADGGQTMYFFIVYKGETTMVGKLGNSRNLFIADMKDAGREKIFAACPAALKKKPGDLNKLVEQAVKDLNECSGQEQQK